MKPKFTRNGMKHAVLAIALISLSLIGRAQTTETFSTGSFIIDMGGSNSNVILKSTKPYGLIYDLLRVDKIPIKWIINQTKVKDGVDFTYNGYSYKGSAFIIPKEYISASIATKISNWVALGVQGNYTTSPLTLDVFKTMVAVPRWTLDAANGAIAEGILLNAGINNTSFPGAYNWKSPAALGCCDDFFVMPHADPTWATHGNLWQWNQTCKGTIWAGCHAVSVLENMTNPSNPAQQTNFLTTNGLTPFGSHSGGSIPYTNSYPSDPVSQYLGVTDAAQLNGSEQIYIPAAGSAWRSATHIVAYDPTQANVPVLAPDLSNAASVIVWGRGFGSTSNGYVMYEAGHSINKGSVNDAAAQRAFFDFSFFQVIEKSPILPTITGISAGQNVQVGGTVTCSIGAATSIIPGTTFTYQWQSSCGGTFTPASGLGQTVTWTAPGTTGTCALTCVVTDNCGRASFQTISPVNIVPPPVPPIAVTDSKQIDNGCLSSVSSLTFSTLANDYDPQGGPVSFVGLNMGSASPAGAGTWTSSPDGTVVFTPNSNFSGTATITYTMQNQSAITATGTINATIGQTDSHGCTPSNVWGVANTDFITNTSIIAVGNAAGIVGELTTDPSMDDEEGTFTAAATDYIDMGTTAGTNYIDLQLPVTMNINDTVVIHWGKKTNNGTTVLGVRQSATSTFSGATTNYTISGAGNLPTDTRYPIAANGMSYIRIQVGTGTTQNLYIDAIEFEVWGCVSRVPGVNADVITDL
ncbi:MAG TPA: Ig-like domain-containing protein, partial [Ferruginibacter sp.]|nr:Ig-like domain-containing protein [Ferruginibacter sp.]